MIIKQSIISFKRMFFVNQTGTTTPLTGAVITPLISQNGNAFAAPNGTITEVANGYYYINYSAQDTVAAGNLVFYGTAAGADPIHFEDQVEARIFTDLSIDVNGNANVTSNCKQNTVWNGFTFIMTSAITHAPQTGLTVTATRSLDGSAYAACANAVTEVGNGTYKINLAATDTNAQHVMLAFTATGADPTFLNFVTQP